MNVTTPLYHLIYASTAAERLSQTSIIDLMKISRRNNQAWDLTGMLLHRDGIYLQFLEGPRESIETLLSWLQQDRRHNAIRILREGPAPHRLFADCAMAYKNLAGSPSTHFPSQPSRDPSQMLVELFDEMLVA